MYSTASCKITKEEYYYLYPAISRSKLSNHNDNYFFVGTLEDLEDALNRLKGWYDFYDSLGSMVVYKCMKEKSLNPFRKFVKSLEL